VSGRNSTVLYSTALCSESPMLDPSFQLEEIFF